MVLLRQILGEVLRRQRLTQRLTLRQVSEAAKVSLGYLSEIERGQKEASSELLAAICEALGVRLSDLLRLVGEAVAFAELDLAMRTELPSGVTPLRKPQAQLAGARRAA